MKNIEKFQKRLKENIKIKEKQKTNIFEINSKIKKDEGTKNEYLKDKEYQNFALNLLTKIIFEKKKKKLGILKTEKTININKRKKNPIIINYDIIFIPDIKTLNLYRKRKKLLHKKYGLNSLSENFFFSRSKKKNFKEKTKKIKSIEIIIPKFNKLQNYYFDKNLEKKNSGIYLKKKGFKYFRKKDSKNFVKIKKIKKLKNYWHKISGIFPTVFIKIKRNSKKFFSKEIDLTKKQTLL